MFTYFGFSGKSQPKKDIEISQLLTGLLSLEKSFSATLNDQVSVAKAIFDTDSSTPDMPNPFIKFGKGIFSFQTCLMGFEETSFATASQDLQDAEVSANIWSSEITTQLKNSEAGSQIHNELLKAKLSLDIVTADCLLMLSTIAFLSQSLSEYARAAYRLKRSYDIYHATNKSALCQFDSTEAYVLTSSQLESQKPLSKSSGDYLQDFVVSGVSFGLGLFKLLLASLPKKAKGLLSGFGFGITEKSSAISHLRYSMTFKGLHGSLSSILLITYYSGWVSFASHLPFVDTLEFQEAEKIIPCIREVYPMGKIWRFLEAKFIKLKGNLEESALLLKETLEENTDSWPEINYLIQYELGWCEILKGDYERAIHSFKNLRESTNWSKAFYCYLEATCYLGIKNTDKAVELLKMVPSLIKRKFGGRAIPVELFVKNRAVYYLSQLQQPSSQLVLVLPILETIYFFNGFHFMTPELLSIHVNQLEGSIKKVKNSDNGEELATLSHLVLGALHRELNNSETAHEHIKKALGVSKSSSLHSTTLSYGHFELAALELSEILSQPTNSMKNNPVTQHLATIDRYAYQSDLEERLQLKIQWLRESLSSKVA